MDLPDPNGYGRIVRDRDDRVVRIVEQKDANERELEISEMQGFSCHLLADGTALEKFIGPCEDGPGG